MDQGERTPDADWVVAKPNHRASKMSCQTERGQLTLTLTVCVCQGGGVTQDDPCLSAGSAPVLVQRTEAKGPKTVTQFTPPTSWFIEDGSVEDSKYTWALAHMHVHTYTPTPFTEVMVQCACEQSVDLPPFFTLTLKDAELKPRLQLLMEVHVQA